MLASAVALVGLLATGADAAPLADMLPRRARGGALYKQLLAQKEAELELLRQNLNLPAGWAPNATANFKSSVVDNFAPAGTSGTFRQKFFFDTTFCGDKCFDPSTPVVCEVTGEWTNTASASGAMAELAQRLGAVGCSVEHRQYGDSLVVPRTDLQGVKKYLTVEQSVADFANFLVYFEQFLANGGNAPPASAVASFSPGYQAQRKWVIAGGSYAGALVSWITVDHGDLLTATWASSGVVNAIFDFYQFDQTSTEALGPDCAKASHAVVSAFEANWASNSAQILSLYNVPTAPNGQQYFTQTDMAWAIADSIAMSSQYGYGSMLCSYLNSTARPYPNAPMPPGGNYLTGMDALRAHAAFTLAHYGSNFAGCYYSSYCLANQATNPSLDDGTTWVAQCCNQLAYWQRAPSGFSIRSSLLTTDYFMSQCRAAYGNTTFPDTAAFNKHYGGARPNVPATSKVFAYQGSQDPWQPAGVNEDLSENYLQVTAVCGTCSHCRDLHASNATGDDPALTAARQTILNQLVDWTVNSSSSGLSPGVIAAIAVGSVVGLAALFFGVRWVRARGFKKQGLAAQESVDGFYSPSGNSQGYGQVPNVAEP